MTPNENNPDNPSSPDLLKITLRGGKENDKTINLEITDEMTSEEALEKLKKELESLNYRIENLQDLLVDGTISPKKAYQRHRFRASNGW